jgi:hypothetical protein
VAKVAEVEAFGFFSMAKRRLAAEKSQTMTNNDKIHLTGAGDFGVKRSEG